MAFLRFVVPLIGLSYLGYRVLMTGDGAHPVLFFLLLAAEAFGVLRLALEMSLVGRPRPADRSPAPGVTPDGDVVVVVTDEPDSEVRAAVLSARLVKGSKRLIVVDRDNRRTVDELCQRLRIERVAGKMNADLGLLINEALLRSESLLTLLIPADVVVMPDALTVSADAFSDPEVAVVVSRVEQANATHTVDFGGYGEDRIRDELMIDTLDDEAALPWWSGTAVVRRHAIVDAGGMATGRQGVTLETGVRLQAKGWKITDVPVVVARRLTPWSDDRLLHRWSRDLHERLSVLVDKETPRRNEHSSRRSRRVYRIADVMVGRSIQRLVLVGVLLVTMFTSALPLVADPWQLVPIWVAWQGSSFLFRRMAFAPIGFVSWMSNDFRLLTTNLVVAWHALRKQPLEIDLMDPAPGRRARAVLLIGLQVVLSVSIAVLVTGVVRPAHGDFATLASIGLAGWLWMMILQARTGLRLRQGRKGYRTFEELEVYASAGQLGVIGVSPFGIDVVSARALKKNSKLRVAFGLPQPDGTAKRVEVSTVVSRTARDGKHHVAYLRFHQLDDERMDRITEYVAVMAGHRALRDSAPDHSGQALVSAEPLEAGVAEPG